MISGAGLGGTHPNRNVLWKNVVDQIMDLLKNEVSVIIEQGKTISISVRVQLVTFDLPALAHHCNIIQYNGYHGCPDCTIPGVAIDWQVVYPYSQDPHFSSLDSERLHVSRLQWPHENFIELLEELHVSKCLRPEFNLFDVGRSSTFVRLSIHAIESISSMENKNVSVRFVVECFLNLVWIFPSSFSAFLLYVSPIYVALYLPDVLAVHFLHYFRTVDELTDIDDFLNYYHEHLRKH